MAKFTMYDETLHTLKEQFNESQAQVWTNGFFGI